MRRRLGWNSCAALESRRAWRTRDSFSPSARCVFRYHTLPEKALLEYCNAHQILFESWVPLARPDSWTQQPPCASNPTLDPTSAAISAKYNVSNAQLQLIFQVQLGMSVIPRSQNAAHMTENLNLFDTTISDADMATLWTLPQSICEPGACTNPVVAGAYPQTCVNNGK